MSLPTSASPTVNILVVDDYPNAADLLARSLLRLDSRLEVVAAISAYQALEYVQKGAVDILITDMDMPDLTGLELIERSQKGSQGGRVVSFLITAAPTQELKIEARELKVREVFHKPVHPDRICEAISRVLQEMQQELS